MAVAVALGPALGAGLTVLGAAHRVGIGRQQGVDHGLQQTAHQVRGGLSQSLVKGSSRVDNVRSGHRDDVLSRIRWKVDSKDHTVTAPTTNTRASHRRLHHTTRHYRYFFCPMAVILPCHHCLHQTRDGSLDPAKP